MWRLYCAISPASFMWIRDAVTLLNVNRIICTLSTRTIPEWQCRLLMKEQWDCGYLQQHSGVSGTLLLILVAPVKCFCQMHKAAAWTQICCSQTRSEASSYRSLCFLVPSSWMAKSMESEGKRFITHKWEETWNCWCSKPTWYVVAFATNKKNLGPIFSSFNHW